VIVEELRPEHFERIKLRQLEKETLDAFHARLGQLIEVASRGPAYAVVHENEVLVIGGLALVWGRVWEAWLLSSEGLDRHHIAAARAVVRTLRATEVELGSRVQRIQAQAPVSQEWTARWFKFLGLTYESTAKKYTVLGEDAVIYAKVIDGN
jgi:hypothetical protein